MYTFSNATQFPRALFLTSFLSVYHWKLMWMLHRMQRSILILHHLKKKKTWESEISLTKIKTGYFTNCLNQTAMLCFAYGLKNMLGICSFRHSSLWYLDHIHVLQRCCMTPALCLSLQFPVSIVGIVVCFINISFLFQ